MEETTEQYVARISGYVEGKNHLRVLQATVKKLKSMIQRAPRRGLVRSHKPGKWSAGEILAHLAESELVFGYRLRLVLGSNGAEVQAFDQNQWQANAGYLKKDVKRSFELFRVLRENNVALLKSLPKERWDAFGMHQERGRENIARMVELYAGHDVNHLRQMENIVKSGRKNKSGRGKL